jgi:hypothetical protein
VDTPRGLRVTAGLWPSAAVAGVAAVFVIVAATGRSGAGALEIAVALALGMLIGGANSWLADRGDRSRAGSRRPGEVRPFDYFPAVLAFLIAWVVFGNADFVPSIVLYVLICGAACGDLAGRLTLRMRTAAG